MKEMERSAEKMHDHLRVGPSLLSHCEPGSLSGGLGVVSAGAKVELSGASCGYQEVERHQPLPT